MDIGLYRLNTMPSIVRDEVRLRTALFWVITQRILAICYRRFGTTYRSYPQGEP